jgi:hypothetical protein
MEQQLEMPNLGNPKDSMQVTGKTKYTVLYGATGTQQTKTIEARDGNGTFKVVGVETQKSAQVPPAQGATALSDKPK